MVSDELSGAVRILRQTTSAGTELPAEPFCPYSARQSRMFMVTKNALTRMRVIREIMASNQPSGKKAETTDYHG